MRVAIIGGYPVDEVAIGGAANVCRQIAQLLAARDDLDVHAVTATAAFCGERHLEDGRVHVHVAGAAGWLPLGVRLYFGVRRRQVRLLREVAPDIVHAQDPADGLFAAEAGFPTVMTVHGILFREVGFARHLRRLWGAVHLHYYRKGLRRVGHIISISPYAEEELRPWTDAAFHFIPNPVNPGFFGLDPGDAEPGRILHVGLLVVRKCVLELIQAFERVCRRHPNARLRIVGELQRDPAYVQAVRALIARQGLGDAVEILGVLSEEQLLEEMRRASILALMSRQETAPGCIGEAMAAGRAVVSSRICGIPHMVDDGITGLLAEAGDVDAFAAHLERLVADPALCREMGRRGQERAMREYHPDRVVDQTLEVYRRVLQQEGAAAPDRKGEPS